MLVVLGAVPRESETTGDTLVNISIIIDHPQSVYTASQERQFTTLHQVYKKT